MSAPINTGGPAFPVEFDHQTFAPRNVEEAKRLMSGMTLRDYFAAKAMQARITAAWTEPGPSKTAFKEWREGLPPDSLVGDFHDYLAWAAYEMADAMLAARQGGAV